MRPRRGVVGKERLIGILNCISNPGVDLLMDPLTGIFLILEFIRAMDDFVLSVLLPHVVKRHHIVDMMAAVEVIKPLIGRQVLTIVPQVPLTKAPRGISGAVQGFGNGNLIPEHTVRVSAHLHGVELPCGCKW